MIDLHRALVRIVDGKNSGISVLNAAGALVCFCPLQPDDTPERLQKLAKLVAREVGSYLGETPVVAVSQICTKLGQSEAHGCSAPSWIPRPLKSNRKHG